MSTVPVKLGAHLSGRQVNGPVPCGLQSGPSIARYLHKGSGGRKNSQLSHRNIPTWGGHIDHGK